MNHILYSAEDLTAILKAKSFIRNKDILIKTILSDSRKLSDINHALFFALKARRDGHSFIPAIYEAGLRSFVISDSEFDTEAYPDANFYKVNDTLTALQDLAAAHRSKFSYPVIGITGSNGKTIVKEWLYQLLAPESNIVRSPKSYNSQIGVPVSVWEMNEENNIQSW